MSILLLSPPPAESTPQAGEHQIRSLVAATESLLTVNGIACRQQHFSIDDIGHHQALQTLTPDPDVELLIFVGYPRLSVADQFQHVAISLNCPLIHIKPRFPGVLIRHDIELTGCTQSGHRLTPTALVPRSYQSVLPEAYHYGQFAPNPLCVEQAVGAPSSVEVSALVTLKISTAVADYNPQPDLETIIAALQRLDRIDTVTLMLDWAGANSSASIKTDEQILCNLADSIDLHVDARISTCSIEHRASQLLPFLRSFDIALFGGSALYADAIEMGIPVYAWRQNESTTLLNDLLDVTSTVNARCPLKQAKTHISELQKESLHEMTARHHALTIHNNMGQFRSALIQLLNEVVPALESRESDSVDLVFERQAVIPATDTVYPGSDVYAARHKLRQVQRKLLKFRQSPTRFIRDSNSPWARRLHPLMPEPKS